MVKITALGHCGFMFEYANQRVLIDPWLGNPACPPALNLDSIGKIDAILVTHGHGSHVGDSAALAKRNGCTVHSVHEVSLFLIHQGLPASQAIGQNFGGTCDILPGWEATLVPSMHSSCCNDGKPGELMPGGGIAGGWFVKTPDGTVIYHAGDTNIFGDMKLFAEIYRPNVVILPIGGHYCMGPKQAAYCIDNFFLDTRIFIPWSSVFAAAKFPVRKGTTEQVRTFVSRREAVVHDLAPGHSFLYVPEHRSKL